MPIDVLHLRPSRGGDPQRVRESELKRFRDPSIVDKVVELDREWAHLQGELDTMNMNRNQLQSEITQRTKAKLRPTEEQKESMAHYKKEQVRLKEEMEKMRTALEKELPKIGNLVHESVPVSNDEEKDNEVIATWGDHREGDNLGIHSDLLWRIGGFEPERGAKVAGHRGYFLRGPGVFFNQALINYALNFLAERGYIPLQPPYFMNKDAMSGVAQLEQFDEELYHVLAYSRGGLTTATTAATSTEENEVAHASASSGNNSKKSSTSGSKKGSGSAEDEDNPNAREKYLIATSEQPLCAYHSSEWLMEHDLPLRYAGQSTCFRKEAGKHGKDTMGIFRVHQFDKIEQFVVCAPEDSWKLHEEMRGTAEEFLQSLNIPYRVVNIVSGELNNAAAKKYDIEGWFPGLQEYKELVSCSNCTDYQSRAMEVRCGSKTGGETVSQEGLSNAKRYVHMLNSTLCALTRSICVILENYQTEKTMEDGTVMGGIEVPKVLVPYMNGSTFVPFVRESKESLTFAGATATATAAAASGGGGAAAGGSGGGKAGAKGGKGAKHKNAEKQAGEGKTKMQNDGTSAASATSATSAASLTSAGPTKKQNSQSHTAPPSDKTSARQNTEEEGASLKKTKKETFEDSSSAVSAAITRSEHDNFREINASRGKYRVGHDSYSTSVPYLIGKHFATLEEYITFMNSQ